MTRLVEAFVAGKEEKLMGLVIFYFHASDQMMVVVSAALLTNRLDGFKFL